MKKYKYRQVFRDKIVQSDKVLLDQSKNVYILTEDVPFSSSSGAAGVVLGRYSNGNVEWVVKGSKTTYGGWKKQQLDNS